MQRSWFRILSRIRGRHQAGHGRDLLLHNEVDVRIDRRHAGNQRGDRNTGRTGLRHAPDQLAGKPCATRRGAYPICIAKDCQLMVNRRLQQQRRRGGMSGVAHGPCRRDPLGIHRHDQLAGNFGQLLLPLELATFCRRIKLHRDTQMPNVILLPSAMMRARHRHPFSTARSGKSGCAANMGERLRRGTKLAAHLSFSDAVLS
jgi:hypothetical protein